MTDPTLPPLPSLPALPPLPAMGPVTRRVPPAGARREWQDAEVVAVRDETAHARTVRLHLPPGAETHVPGQHYVVRMPREDGSWAQRSYSAASAPDGPAERAAGPHVELTVERIDDGELSPALHGVTVGDRLSVRGPFGGWFVWRGDVPALLVGGGSGVVPLAAMLRHRRRGGLATPLHLVVSVRGPQDLFYADELAGAPEVTVVHTRVATPGSARPPGHLSAADLRPVLASFADGGPTCYVCGSTGFAEHAGQLLVELGVPSGDVRVERFGPS